MEEDRTEIIQTTPPAREREVREVNTAPRVTEVRNTVAPRADMDRVESVAYDPYEGRRIAGNRLTALVYWIFGLIEGIHRDPLRAQGARSESVGRLRPVHVRHHRAAGSAVQCPVRQPLVRRERARAEFTDRDDRVRIAGLADRQADLDPGRRNALGRKDRSTNSIRRV